MTARISNAPRRPVMLLAALALAALAGPASASVTTVTNVCDSATGANTVRVVTLSLNTLEYSFRKLPNGPVTVFPGIVNPTSTSSTRLFALPAGTYRLTYRMPTAAPIGTWAPDVVVQPYEIIRGVCVRTDVRQRARPVEGPKG
ncbi:MAG: hypothetical protein Q8L66_15130 [Caulobacter sp.]|nr:hypothetical protein [Caulobacter sp.]